MNLPKGIEESVVRKTRDSALQSPFYSGDRVGEQLLYRKGIKVYSVSIGNYVSFLPPPRKKRTPGYRHEEKNS